MPDVIDGEVIDGDRAIATRTRGPSKPVKCSTMCPTPVRRSIVRPPCDFLAAEALLIAAALAIVTVVVLRRGGCTAIGVYGALGVVLWWTLYEAGVHPTLAGVVMGLLAPTQPFTRHELIDQDELADVSDVGHAAMTVRLAKSSVSTVEWLEHRLHGWASFVAVPIFAIANAGIAITRESLQHAVGSRVVWGVGLGLLVGMPIGILAATYLVVRLGVGALPDGVTWRDLTATAIVAGLGFTVSLFVAELAFVGPEADDAKIAVLLASVAAGTCGLLAARRSVSLRHDEQPRPREGSGRQLATRTAHGRARPRTGQSWWTERSTSMQRGCIRRRSRPPATSRAGLRSGVA